MNEVTIEIIGGPKTGKSTIAEEIEKHLRSIGFTVWVAEGHDEGWQVGQQRRVEALRKQTTVMILTRYANRGPARAEYDRWISIPSGKGEVHERHHVSRDGDEGPSGFPRSERLPHDPGSDGEVFAVQSGNDEAEELMDRIRDEPLPHIGPRKTYPRIVANGEEVELSIDGATVKKLEERYRGKVLPKEEDDAKKAEGRE